VKRCEEQHVLSSKEELKQNNDNKRRNNKIQVIKLLIFPLWLTEGKPVASIDKLLYT